MGIIIASLEPGDEIIIKAGFGCPKTEKETKDIITEVDGCSALTVKGIRLRCWDARGIKEIIRNKK